MQACSHLSHFIDDVVISNASALEKAAGQLRQAQTETSMVQKQANSVRVRVSYSVMSPMRHTYRQHAHNSPCHIGKDTGYALDSAPERMRPNPTPKA